MNRLIVAILALVVIAVSCQKEVSFEVGTPATGALQNVFGECAPINVGGTYQVNKNLNDSNFVEVNVDVLTPGNYKIVTDTVNGYYFIGTGNFASAGSATVKLKGAGTPLAAGTDNFFVFFDSTFCEFSVTVTASGTNPPPPTGSQVYFPMTTNSWWSYDEGGTDTIKVTSIGATTLAGKSWNRFRTDYGGGDLDTSYYRFDSPSNSYYQYINTSDFDGSPLTFTQPFIELLFLKENLAANATWNSDHQASLSGFPVTLRFKYTTLNNNATLTVNGKNFVNVYRIQLQVQLGSMGTFSDAGAPTEFFYAKGVGLIRLTDGIDSQNIRHYLVN